MKIILKVKLNYLYPFLLFTTLLVAMMIIIYVFPTFKENTEKLCLGNLFFFFSKKFSLSVIFCKIVGA